MLILLDPNLDCTDVIFQEIIGQIAEKGAQFGEQQYTNLLSLAHRSQRGAKEEELNTQLNKLKDILTELESTV